MKTRIALLYFFGTAFALFSCGGSAFEHEIKTLDSLHQELDKIEKELLTYDTAKIDTISTVASNNINTIKHIYTTDTIGMTLAKKITDYKYLRKVANKFRRDRFEIRNELALRKKQLEMLSDDLSHNAWEKEKGKQFFAAEKLATIGIVETYKVYKQQFENSIQQFDSLNPVITEYITVNSVSQEKNK